MKRVALHPKSNGILRLPGHGLMPGVAIHGGPFRNAPEGMFGVCLLEKGNGLLDKDDFHLPIDDFSVPHDRIMVEKALQALFRKAMVGQEVWIGCMGGFGRTGLVMALAAKAYGVPNPVVFVRENYNARAVETTEQEEYVRNFDMTTLQSWLFWESVWSLPRRIYQSWEPIFPWSQAGKQAD
jgi:hypothetical protein